MKVDKSTRRTINENAEALKLAKGELVSAIEEYNAKRADLHDSLNTMAEEMRGEYDEKSERWQTSEKGEAASAWVSDIEEKVAEVADDIDIDLPDIDEVVGFPDQPEE
jgi:hypothetical protein